MMSKPKTYPAVQPRFRPSVFLIVLLADIENEFHMAALRDMLAIMQCSEDEIEQAFAATDPLIEICALVIAFESGPLKISPGNLLILED